MEKVIQSKLQEIEQKENVKIILAVESGSRAWGFASPDSDYDVRFVYVRKTKDYLRVDSIRDVIEWQLDDTLDINGWDLRKALQLLYKSNPTFHEWCSSPIVYRASPEFSRLREMLPQYFSVKKGLFHYWHMAESNYRTSMKGDMVKLKKYFYVLRPLLAGKWIVEKRCQPPILFTELIKEELDTELQLEVQRLLDMKRETSELGLAPGIPIIDDFILKTMPELMSIGEAIDDTETDWERLNEFFYSCLSE